MDEKELNASNFMPEDLLEIICILEKGDLKRHSYKIIRKRNYFSLITKFPAIEEQRFRSTSSNSSG